MANKRIVNITFQVHSQISQNWAEIPIIYVLEKVPEDKNIEELLHALSVALNFSTIRTTHLFLSDPVTSKTAARYTGIYYQAKPTFYNKPKK
jgi:hypothetical protein